MLLDTILYGIWLPVGTILYEMLLPVDMVLCETWLPVGVTLFGTIRFDEEVELSKYFDIISEWEDGFVDDNDN